MRVIFIVTLAALTILSPAALGDEESPARETADSSIAKDGKLLFSIYCTSCHGPSGRGDGPAAASLKPPPTDLTRLSLDNDDKFPRARIIMSIDGRTVVPGHIDGDMPIWGLTLRDPDSDANQEPQVGKKILQLVAYLESIQQPEPAAD